MPDKKERFLKSAKEYCCRQLKNPGFYWLTGTGIFTFLGGYQHITYQIVAGVFDYTSQGVAAFRGGQKFDGLSVVNSFNHQLASAINTFGYPIAAALNSASVCAWQVPYLTISHSYMAWIGFGLNVLGNTSVMAEPWCQVKAYQTLRELNNVAKPAAAMSEAKVKLLSRPYISNSLSSEAKFCEARRCTTSRLKAKVRLFALQTFSNPRPFWYVCHTASLVPLMINDFLHSPKHFLVMLPCYISWNVGNLALALTRPTIYLPQHRARINSPMVE